MVVHAFGFFAQAAPAVRRAGGMVSRDLVPRRHRAGIAHYSANAGPLDRPALRLPEYGVRIGVVLATIAVGAAIVILGWPPRLGIDLKGGVILVYEVKETQSLSDLPDVASQVDRRLEKNGEGAAVVTPVEGRRIEVRLPRADAEQADHAAKIIDGMTRAHADHSLKLPTVSSTATRYVDLRGRCGSAAPDVDMEKLIGALSKRVNPAASRKSRSASYGERQVEIIIPDVDPVSVEAIKKEISTEGVLEFRITADLLVDKEIVDLALRPGTDAKSRWAVSRPAGSTWTTKAFERDTTLSRGRLRRQDRKDRSAGPARQVQRAGRSVEPGHGRHRRLGAAGRSISASIRGAPNSLAS